MATKSQLKQYFETGKIPTQAQFGELIDYIAPAYCETPTVSFNNIIPGPGTYILYNTANNNKLVIKYYIAIIDSKLVLYKFERFSHIYLVGAMKYEIGIIKSLDDNRIDKLTIDPNSSFITLENLIDNDNFTIKIQ
jgi:hypothetical protein